MPGLKLITAPTDEPVVLDDVKHHLRVDGDDDDDLILGLIRAAREDLDGRLGRLGKAFITQDWDYYLDAFPSGRDNGEIIIPLAPLQSVTHIKYDPPSGAEQTVDPSVYIVDTVSTRPRVVLAPSQSWPATRDAINSVRVRVRVGYGNGPDAVPAFYKHAMLILIGHLFEHRGDDDAEIPAAYFNLIGVYGGVGA